MYSYILALFVVFSLHAEEVAVYLTIQRKPDKEMTVCWVASKTEAKQQLKYKQKDGDQWYQVDAEPREFPEKLPYTLFVAELQGLTPDTRYEFVLSDGKTVYQFNTLPSTLERSVKFVVGGDIYHDEVATVETMNQIASAQDPDFALLGGDIAYSGSKFIFFKEEGERWIQFLKSWFKTMRRKDGSLIPLITAIGNHDVNGRYDQDPSRAFFYYFLLPTHSPIGFQVLDFGNFLSLWVMDSGHASSVDGMQTLWLEKTLLARIHTPFKVALYHVPAYPSARAYDNKRSSILRKYWVPLFERFGMTVAFENHDHAYKRTHLIKEGKVADKGVLYMGDGAWGVEYPRLPKTPEQLWYLATSAQKRHILLATLSKEEMTIQAIDSKGQIFDTTVRKP